MAGTSSPSSDTQYQSTIHKLKRCGINWGWDIQRIYTDDSGIFCIRFQTCRTDIYAITKDYIFRDEYASFPKRIVHRAEDYGQPIAVFFGEEPRLGNSYIFDPEVVLNHGKENMANVPLPQREQWVDIELSKGVLVGDFVSGNMDVPNLVDVESN
jgi:hypothetical protein